MIHRIHTGSLVMLDFYSGPDKRHLEEVYGITIEIDRLIPEVYWKVLALGRIMIYRESNLMVIQ